MKLLTLILALQIQPTISMNCNTCGFTVIQGTPTQPLYIIETLNSAMFLETNIAIQPINSLPNITASLVYLNSEYIMSFTCAYLPPPFNLCPQSIIIPNTFPGDIVYAGIFPSALGSILHVSSGSGIILNCGSCIQDIFLEPSMQGEYSIATCTIGSTCNQQWLGYPTLPIISINCQICDITVTQNQNTVLVTGP
jgi:hypothetical protein